MMYSKLLLPTDGSQVSRRAFAHAEALANAVGASVLVLEVIESRVDVMRRASAAGWLPGSDGFVTGEQADALIEAQRRAAESHFDALRATFDRDRALQLEQRIEQGAPGPTIVRVAAEEHCDAIVMATHGRTGLSRLFLGSVAEYVLRHATCPVILVPGPERLREVASPGASASARGGSAA